MAGSARLPSVVRPRRRIEQPPPPIIVLVSAVQRCNPVAARRAAGSGEPDRGRAGRSLSGLEPAQRRWGWRWRRAAGVHAIRAAPTAPQASQSARSCEGGTEPAESRQTSPPVIAQPAQPPAAGPGGLAAGTGRPEDESEPPASWRRPCRPAVPPGSAEPLPRPCSRRGLR